MLPIDGITMINLKEICQGANKGTDFNKGVEHEKKVGACLLPL